MGREKNSIQKLKEMKLIGTLAAVAAAQWNGQSDDSTCGMQLSGDSMVNSTCTVSGSSIKSMYAGNGAFITGSNTMTGFDGMSGNADVVVFFDQDCSSGNVTTPHAGMPHLTVSLMVLQQTVSSLWKLSMLPILVWLIFKSLVFPQGTLLLFLLLTTMVTLSVLQTSHPQVVPSVLMKQMVHSQLQLEITSVTFCKSLSMLMPLSISLNQLSQYKL